MIELVPQPLTPAAFSQFGEVIALSSAQRLRINQGLTIRFNDLASIDTDIGGGRPLLNVFRTTPVSLPHRVTTMERHPLGSQAFLPMHPNPFLVLVAGAGADSDSDGQLTADRLVLFITDGCQGVNIARNTWHHYQLALPVNGECVAQDFVVIDRGGPGHNLDERVVEDDVVIVRSDRW